MQYFLALESFRTGLFNLLWRWRRLKCFRLNWLDWRRKRKTNFISRTTWTEEMNYSFRANMTGWLMSNLPWILCSFGCVFFFLIFFFVVVWWTRVVAALEDHMWSVSSRKKNVCCFFFKQSFFYWLICPHPLSSSLFNWMHGEVESRTRYTRLRGKLLWLTSEWVSGWVKWLCLQLANCCFYCCCWCLQLWWWLHGVII